VSAKPTPAGEERVADLPEEPFAEKPVASAAAAEPAVAPMPTIAPAATEPVAEPEPPAVADEIEDDLLAASLEEPAAAAAATAPATAAPHAPLFDTEKFLAQLNRQSFDDLVKIEGISRALAKRIIEQRTALTKFTRLEEVRRIPGITRKTFEALAGASPETLNKLLHAPHDQELSLPDVVRLACGLPGVAGCLLTAADGLLLTAHLPQGLDDSRLSAFAPALFRKIRDYTEELGVGQVQRFTLFTDRQPVTIFQAGAIYLVVIHDPQHFSKALLRRLTRISEELARLCQQRAVV
jgi:predicted regulator of Ras-like GTPase activity (Roadblock/LC7/MglB family)